MIEKNQENDLMKNIRFLIVIFILFLTNSIYADSQILELIEPSHESLYEESYASIVVKINSDKIDKIEIAADGYDVFAFNVIKSKRDYYCKSVKLHLGENQILVKGYSKDKLIAKTSSTIFYKSPIGPGFYFAPEKFKKGFFHSDEKERVCSKCHDMRENGIKSVAFIDVKESNCYNCHKLITSQKFAHAPTLNWLCTMCHNGKAGKNNKQYLGKSKYLTPIPVIDICFSCHKKKDRLWWSKKYQHDPMSEEECNKCHNPHSSDFKNFLRKPPWDLCISCHQSKLSKNQLLYNNSKLSKKQADKFICINCHDPHKSNRRYFLKKNVKDDKFACEKLNVEQKDTK